MKLKCNRLVSTIGLCALSGLLPAAALADNVPADRFPQTTATQTTATIERPMVMAPASAPAAQTASAEERVTRVPTSEQLNVTTNPAFGRVASK